MQPSARATAFWLLDPADILMFNEIMDLKTGSGLMHLTFWMLFKTVFQFA